MSLNTIQKIVSNCRVFLDSKSKNIAIIEDEANQNEEFKKQIKNDMPSIDAFDIAKVLSVGLCKDEMISDLTLNEAQGYHKIEEPIYNMVLNNIRTQFNINSETKNDIQKARSEKRIKVLKSKIIEIDVFKMSQIISIAFLKNPKDVFNDFIL